MRLICPNCGAQYEVDGSMIPDDGRDVQCSACGHTWFQLPEGVELPAEPEPAEPSEAAPDDELAEGGEESPDAEDDAESSDEIPVAGDAGASYDEAASDDTEATYEDFAEPDADGDASPDSAQEAAQEPASEPALPVAAAAPVAPPPHAPRPSEKLDGTILDMLREEARRETEARRAEQAQALETQPELGLTEASEPTDRLGTGGQAARLRGDEADADEEDDLVPPGSRGDLLPDIEEINSTLRPASEHPEAAEIADPVAVEARQRSGFRWGFTLMIVLAALLVIAYVFAPQIGQQVPALEPALVGYVETANQVRDGAEAFLDRTTQALSDLTAGETDGDVE
ncbi:zinc-ribbon domain-containing protein [Palleronia sp. KMU-117]|uniref:zinc-ribbon domain-containing protein n=1 Tax=Palleronia sp. KMU-117 TaxID=3434108 RepID=UPI003D70A80E